MDISAYRLQMDRSQPSDGVTRSDFFGIASRSDSFVSEVFRYLRWTGLGVGYLDRLVSRLVGI